MNPTLHQVKQKVRIKNCVVAVQDSRNCPVAVQESRTCPGRQILPETKNNIVCFCLLFEMAILTRKQIHSLFVCREVLFVRSCQKFLFSLYFEDIICGHWTQNKNIRMAVRNTCLLIFKKLHIQYLHQIWGSFLGPTGPYGPMYVPVCLTKAWMWFCAEDGCSQAFTPLALLEPIWAHIGPGVHSGGGSQG